MTLNCLVKQLCIISIVLLCRCLNASIVSGTATGIVGANQLDTYGFFGPANASLSGKIVILTYSYNTTEYTTSLSCGANCTYFNSQKGVVSAASITISVDGISKTFPSITISQIEEDGGPASEFELSVWDASLNPYAGIFIRSANQYYPYAFDLYSSTGIEIINLSTTPIAPPPPTILDPVPDLLDGAKITTDPATLASGGRVVSGIAADGAAQLVFRISAQAAGDTVKATLLSDRCTDPTTPSTCALSTSSDDDGGLFIPGTPVTSSSVLDNHAPGIADATSKEAFIAYRAPVDFNRPSKDETASTRNVYVQFSYSSANATTPYYISTPVPITIIRPPVVLIHGYASDAAETWKYFVANTVSDPRFRMFEVNYGDFIDVKSTTPRLGGLFCEYFDGCVTHMRQSDLGFTTSATQTPRVLPDKAVSDQTIDFITNFSTGSNPLSKPVAAVRADVIGHSMGGLIARQWSSQTADYYTDASFGQGYIHKMITLGTPHLGSPLGTLGVQPDSACFRDFSAGNLVKDLVVPSRILISSAVLDDGTKDGKLVGGAVGELAGDGIDTKGMSPALQFLQTNGSSIPTAKIGGTIGDIPRGLARTIFYLVHHDCDKTDPLARRFTPESYSTIFDPNVFVPRTPGQAGNPEGSSIETFSDGAVPLTSALDNPRESAACDNYFRFCGYAHGENTQTLTGADHNLVRDGGLIFDRIQDLLNLTVTNTGVWGPQ